MRRRLSRCSRICSRVSWANLLLELLRLHGEARGQSLSEVRLREPEKACFPLPQFLLKTKAARRVGWGRVWEMCLECGTPAT